MGGMMDIRRQVLHQDLPPVPSAYQKVDCVTGIGRRSAFDTGIDVNNDNLRIKCCFEPIEINGNGYKPFICGYVNEQSNAWRIISAAGDLIVKRFYLNLNSRAGSSINITPNVSVLNNRLYFDVSRQSVSLTMKNKKYPSSSLNFINGDTISNKTILIGSNHLANTANDGNTKWYYIIFYDNGVLIRYYVPCYRKSDGLAGFWECVNKEFKPSQALDDFIIE